MSTSKSCEARLEYVTAEEVNCLKLLELDFSGTILLICPEYIQACDLLDLVSPTVKRSVVITGQPGNGSAFYGLSALLLLIVSSIPI